jgi:hypothetical protein
MLSHKFQLVQNKMKGSLLERYAQQNVLHILKQSDEDFQEWYNSRMKAAQRLLRDYELIGSIPQPYTRETLASLTHQAVGEQLQALRNSVSYLEEIKRLRDSHKKGEL